ncbi:hypothetical protein ACH5RR_041245 [Cinchona calisaya]|uniref:Lachrymatory factor synthase n=1 Tax=Cinchona calisaya TaxID=153742 RepID=A0ABD2XYH3_9GENT
MAAQEQAKWEGKATAKLKGVRAEQVWPLLEDFCSFDKWIPTIDTCHQVEGVKGQPGLVRYCASTPLNTDDESKNSMTKWCHEKLIAIDPILRCLIYEVLENNMGIKSYIGTIKLLDDDDTFGCQIEWSFLADPVDGLSFQDLSSYLNFTLQGMAENMERALQIK